MRRTLKVLAALLTYPTEELVAAVPELRAALDAEALLPQRHRERLDRIIEELGTRDLFDLQERYVHLFDRTRSLSLHLFEHVHGESRDRGQAMVDLAALYARHGLLMEAAELPDYLPLFLEFLSQTPEAEAREHLAATVHVLEAIRQRLKRRKAPYSSVFSALQVLAAAEPQADAVEEMLSLPDPDPNDLEALDTAWREEPVTFGPTATPGCGPDTLSARIRQGRRPAPGAIRHSGAPRTVFTYAPGNRR